MDDSIFIKMLEYGEQCGIKGTKWEDLEQWLKANKIINELSQEERNRLHTLYRECFEGNIDAYNNRLLKTEYYFSLDRI